MTIAHVDRGKSSNIATVSFPDHEGRRGMMRTEWKTGLLLCLMYLSGQSIAFAGDADMSFPFPEYVPSDLQALSAMAPMPDHADLDFVRRNYSAWGVSCEINAKVTPVADAMLRLEVSTPCQRGGRVDVVWSHVSASFLTSVTGALDVTLPALEAQTTVGLRFENGTQIEKPGIHEDAEDFERVALTWRGNSDVSLIALPLGRSGFRRDGQKLQLGDRRITDGTRSEIYSIRTTFDRTYGVRLHVEVSPNKDNCETQQTFNAVQKAAQGGLVAIPVSFQLPECDGGQSILVMENVLRDLAFERN